MRLLWYTGKTGYDQLHYAACQAAGGSRDGVRTDAPIASSVPSSEDILSGELAAGRQLPSERDAGARTFGVGRPLIREALRSLAEMGLIETRPGARHVRARGGTTPASTGRVGHRHPPSRRDRAASCPRRASLLETRGRRATPRTRATPADLARLEAALERLERERGDRARRRTTWPSTWRSRRRPTTRSSR